MMSNYTQLPIRKVTAVYCHFNAHQVIVKISPFKTQQLN